MANSFQQEQEAPELERISELAENLVLRLPRCEPVMIRKTIQEVFREFCRETKCLTAERHFTMKPGQTEFPLMPQYGGVVTDVRAVAVGNQRLKFGLDFGVVGTTYFVVVLMPLWAVELPHHVPPAERHLHMVPTVLHVIQEEVPSMNSEDAPCGFIERHGEAICSGVMARLCSMTGRSWTDPQVAALERINYENAKSEERMKRETPRSGRFIDTSQVL